MRVSATPVFLFACFLLLFPFFTRVANAQSTPGCHAITPDEQAALKEAGAIVPSNGQFCDSDKSLLFGSCTESPYPYLESKKARAEVDVAHFNADYACRLSKFLKASDAAGMRIKITSGYRSIAQQASLYANRGATPVAPPGRSRHNFGIAADLTFDGVWPNYSANSAANTPLCIQRLPSCKWAHDNAPSFGLRWPMVVEPWHIEPGTAVKGGEQLMADSGYWSNDSGTAYSGGPLSPFTNGQYYCIASVAPLVTVPMMYPPGPGSGCLNAQSSAQIPYSSSPLMQPAPAPLQSQTPTQTQSSNPTTNQPQICDPKFSCTGNVTYYQTSSCTTQVYQVCQYGCAASGTSCAVSTSTSATSTRNLTGTSTTIGDAFDVSNTNDNTNDNGSGSGPSVSDLINAMAGGITFTSTDVATSTSLAFRLNPTTGDVETLDASEHPTSTVAAGTISSVQPVGGQQTFTSSDISGGYTSGYVAPQFSTIQTILNNLQSALVWALNVLKGL